MEMLCMPMTHSPLTIFAIRLRTEQVSCDNSVTAKDENLQDEVENDHNGITAKHAKHIEQVKFRLHPSYC